MGVAVGVGVGVGVDVAVGTGVGIAVAVAELITTAVLDGRFSVGTKVGDGFCFGLQPMSRALTATSTDHLLILKSGSSSSNIMSVHGALYYSVGILQLEKGGDQSEQPIAIDVGAMGTREIARGWLRKNGTSGDLIG